MTVPLTIADWAAAEARFKKHFRSLPEGLDEEEIASFHVYVDMSAEDREEKTPFIYALSRDRKLTRLEVSDEIVKLAEERLLFWSQLRQIAGLQVEDTARGVVEADLEEQYEAKLAALRAEYEGKLAELKANFPPMIARKMAEGLVRAGNGQQTIADLLARVQTMPGLKPITADVMPESDAGGGQRRRRGTGRRFGRGRGGRGGARPGALHRLGALHGLQRVHQPQPQDVRLQRQEAGLHQGPESRALQGPGHGGGALLRTDHPPRHALKPEGKEPGEVDQASGALQLTAPCACLLPSGTASIRPIRKS
jgi:hypothetical protein